QVPRLDVRTLAVVGIDHPRTVSIAPRSIENRRHESVIGKPVVPIENSLPGLHGIGAKRISAAPLNIGWLSEWCSAEVIKEIAFIKDPVTAANRPFLEGPVSEADSGTPISQASFPEVPLPCANAAVACELISAGQSAFRVYFIRTPA